MTFRERKQQRILRGIKKSRPCTACSGYGSYKMGKCGSCGGTGKEFFWESKRKYTKEETIAW